MNDTIRVVISAFIWAIIGGFVALDASRRFDLGYEYLWALGGMVGAPLGAYCTINFREFCAGVRRAFVKTISWRPFWMYWKAWAVTFCGGVVFGITVMYGLSLFVLVFEGIVVDEILNNKIRKPLIPHSMEIVELGIGKSFIERYTKQFNIKG